MCGQEIYCETCGEPTDYGCFLEVEDRDIRLGEATTAENATSTSTIPANDDASNRVESHAQTHDNIKT